MERNVGDLDRAFRVSLAIVLLAMGLIYNQTLLFIPAFILLLTGFLGMCPLYSLLGWSTKTYFDYPSVSMAQPPVAVEVEEKVAMEPEPEQPSEEELVEKRKARRKELFEEAEEEEAPPKVEEKKEKPTSKRRKRRNVRRKNKNKKED